MDPLSIAASIAGLLAIGGSMVSLGRTLHTTAKRLRSAKREIFKFARDVGLFGDLISLVFRFLSDYYSKNSQSPLLQYIRVKRILHRLKRQCRELNESIKVVAPELANLDSNIPLKARWNWVRKKSTIKAFGPEMEGVKNSFNMILLMARLESLYKQDLPEDAEEM